MIQDAANRSITVFWSLVTVLILMVGLTGSLRTLGELLGERQDTSRWLAIMAINVPLLPAATTQEFKHLKLSITEKKWHIVF